MEQAEQELHVEDRTNCEGSFIEANRVEFRIVEE